eukprot:UN23344
MNWESHNGEIPDVPSASCIKRDRVGMGVNYFSDKHYKELVLYTPSIGHCYSMCQGLNPKNSTEDSENCVGYNYYSGNRTCTILNSIENIDIKREWSYGPNDCPTSTIKPTTTTTITTSTVHPSKHPTTSPPSKHPTTTTKPPTTSPPSKHPTKHPTTTTK